MKHHSGQNNNSLIRQSFSSYLVPTLPISITLTTHPLFKSHCFTCSIHTKHCIGYYQIINDNNYFLKLQQLLFLKSMNSLGVFVQFIGVWLEQQQDQKLNSTIKQFLFSPGFNQNLFWEYLICVSKAMLFLDKKKLSHGNMNLYSLLSASVSSSPKIFYFPSMRTSLDIYRYSKQDSDFLFLSPQELQAFKTNNFGLSVSKSDMFNLGTILISILQNNGQKQAYENYCDQQLKDIQKRYGFNVYFILEKMTRINPKERMEWYQIQSYVHQLYSKNSGSYNNKLSSQRKQASPLDFRQGTFKRFYSSCKDLSNEKKKESTREKELERSKEKEKRKRQSIFSNKRNLLSYENGKRSQTEEGDQCMMATCYLKL